MYVGIQQVATFGIAFVTVPVLARLLDPADYGLIAMVTFFTNFASMFANAGLTAATIQRERITHEQSSNLFWIALAVGSGAAALVSLLSPAISWIYSESRLIPITVALSGSFVLTGLTVQHQSLLRRAMRFRELTVIQIFAVFAAQGVGVTWAWMRQDKPDDYWALVAMPVTSSFVLMIGVWIACSWRPGAWRSGAGTVSLLHFGANLTGASMMNYLVRQVDRPLIGWHSGESSLGIYDRAHRLTIFPLSSITTALSAVMIPALSRVAHDPSRLAEAHLRVVRLLTATITLPAMSLVFTADWWIGLLLGPGWEGAAPIFRWLAIAGLVQPPLTTVTWLFIAQDGADKLFKWIIVETVVAVACCVIGLRWGPEGVAAAFSLCIVFFRLPGMVWWASRHDLLDFVGFSRELRNALLPALVVAGAHLALRISLPSTTSAATGVTLSLMLVMLILTVLGVVTRNGRCVVAESRDAIRALTNRGG